MFQESKNLRQSYTLSIYFKLIVLLACILRVFQCADILPLSQKPIEPYSINVGELTYYKFYFRTATLIQIDAHIKITFPKEFDTQYIA